MNLTMRSFNKLSLITLIAVYALILIGSVVRSTGSGMGCPDWPKCFGQWAPPTSVAELPEDYKETYVAYRQKKNQRFAKYLSAFGFTETAKKIAEDESILEETEFNATKTWIEYFNRLAGVIVGFLVAAVFILSVRYWKVDHMIPVIALITLVVVGFQGWIGSVVVSTNLTPWTITLHMLLALLVVFLLIVLLNRSGAYTVIHASPLTIVLLAACMLVLLIQITLGTQVREAIDGMADLARGTWIENAGTDFIIHRSFSWVVLILHVGLVLKLMKTQHLKIFPLTLILLILGTILTGTGMAYFGVPPVLQPVHLLLATITFGVQAFLLLQFHLTKRTVVTQ